MNLEKKKVLIVSLEKALIDDGGLTDFHVHRDVLDRIRSLNIQRIDIVYGGADDKDYFSKIKAIEFFVFAYCKVSVCSHMRSEGLMEEVIGFLPHNMRKKELFLSLEENIKGIDNINMTDFLQ